MVKGLGRSVRNWKKIGKEIAPKILVAISVLFVVRFF